MSSVLLLWMLLGLVSSKYSSEPSSFESEDVDKVALGGVFFEDQPLQESAFRSAVAQTQYFRPLTIKMRRGNVLEVQENLCDLFQEGVYGIVDGTLGTITSHIEALCDSMDIPHVIVNLNDQQTTNWSTVNIYPSPKAFNRLLKEIILKKSWQEFTVLYVKGYSLISVSDILKLNGLYHPFTVSAWELSGNDDSLSRKVLNQVKKSGTKNFVVDCPTENLHQTLTLIQQMGLMSDNFSYIFTSPDLHTIDMETFKFSGANITGVAIVNITESDYERFFTDFTSFPENEEVLIERANFTTSVLLVFDAVAAYANAYSVFNVSAASIRCNEKKSWRLGSSITNIIKTGSVNGMTREVVLDSAGERTNVMFDVFEVTPAELQVVFKENKSSGLWDIRPPTLLPVPDDEKSMNNKTFIVLISTETRPYGFIRGTVDNLEGNSRYDGFAVDLIDEMSQILGFKYIFEPENAYGKKDEKTGQWNGMIAKILKDQADFAITDLAITASRLSAVDFTVPFMNLGISILYKKPSKQPPEMFSFMKAFSRQVWISMFFSIVGLAIVMVFIGRLSHKEWHNPYPCVAQPEDLVNQFSFANAVWLIIGSVMQQGSEIAPIAVAPRMLTSVWWFFTMVMISSYTGLLVSFFTIESKTTPFNSADDLAGQTKIGYGAKNGGATLEFFKNSNNPKYRNMYEQMRKHGWLTSSNDEGRDRAMAENYAFFMESTSIDYTTERFCELMQVGDLLDSKGYGIAMKKNSPYRDLMNAAVVKLQETGVIAKLKNKWWKEKLGGGACTNADQGSDSAELEMKNLIGVFIVLGSGSLGGIFIAMLDMFWGVFKRSIKYQTSFKQELIEEVKFAISFSGDTKPVKRRTVEFDVESSSTKSYQTERSRRTLGSVRSRSHSVALARRRRYS